MHVGRAYSEACGAVGHKGHMLWKKEKSLYVYPIALINICSMYVVPFNT